MVFQGLEEDYAADRLLVPGNRLRHLLRSGPLHLGHEVIWGGALYDDVRLASPLVRHFGAFSLPRRFLRLQEGADLPAGADEPDSKASAGAAVVYHRGDALRSIYFIKH